MAPLSQLDRYFHRLEKSHRPARPESDSRVKSTGYHEDTDKDENSFRFLDLPPEIRNTIYERALANQIVGISYKYKHKPNSILLACKQTYKEAIIIHYSTAEFYFSDPSVGLGWLVNRPEKSRQALSKISFDSEKRAGFLQGTRASMFSVKQLVAVFLEDAKDHGILPNPGVLRVSVKRELVEAFTWKVEWTSDLEDF